MDKGIQSVYLSWGNLDSQQTRSGTQPVFIIWPLFRIIHTLGLLVFATRQGKSYLTVKHDKINPRTRFIYIILIICSLLHMNIQLWLIHLADYWLSFLTFLSQSTAARHWVHEALESLGQHHSYCCKSGHNDHWGETGVQTTGEFHHCSN